MAIVAAMVGLLFAAPFLAFFGALWRAVVLFWPTMVFLGAVSHDVFPAVPALGWWETFLVVALISLLIPTSTNASSND